MIQVDGGPVLAFIIVAFAIGGVLLLVSWLSSRRSAAPAAATAQPAPEPVNQPTPPASAQTPSTGSSWISGWTIFWLVVAVALLGLLFYWKPWQQLDRVLDERDAAIAMREGANPASTVPVSVPARGVSNPVWFPKGYRGCKLPVGGTRNQLYSLYQYRWLYADEMTEEQRLNVRGARFESLDGAPRSIEVYFVPEHLAC
jgi:hypothetical protein